MALKRYFPLLAFLPLMVAAQDQAIICKVFLSDSSEMDKGQYYISEKIGLDASRRLRPVAFEQAAIGLDAYDLLLLQKHLLGTQPLQNPYKLIAADVNKSGNISPSDIIEMRKAILGITHCFPSESWKFIDKTTTFPDPSNPFNPPLPTSISIMPDIGGNPSAHAHFQGIKMGDLDGSAFACSEYLDKAVNYIGAGQLNAEVTSLNTEYKELAFRYRSDYAIEALEGDFEFDATQYEFFQIEEGEVEAVDLGSFNLEEVKTGKIRFAWFSALESRAYSGEVKDALLFKIILKKRIVSDMKQSETSMLATIKPMVVAASAWTANSNMVRLEQKGDIQIAERKAINETGLVAVSPNPTSGIVTLDFELETDAAVKCFLFSSFGHLEHFEQQELPKGNNKIVLSRLSELPAGVYTYHLSNGNWIKKGRIIKQ